MKTWEVNKEELLKSDKWQRVTRKVGNVTYLYYFFILEEGNQTYILNTRALKCSCIKGVHHNIIPLVVGVSTKDYIYKERTEYKKCDEYICIDNFVLDNQFNQTFIETRYDRCPTILDSLGYYVAAEDSQGIHLFAIGYDCKCMVISERPYYCQYVERNHCLGLFIDDELNFLQIDGYFYFDPQTKKFFMDVARIKKKDLESKEAWAKEQGYGEHYTLMDGLDGEVEALGNIDWY